MIVSKDATAAARVAMHHPTFTRRTMLQAGAVGILGLGGGELPAGFDDNARRPTDHPAIAAVANHATRPVNNLPPAVVLPHTLVHRTGRIIPGQFAGEMGSRWDPWVLRAARDCGDAVYG